MDQNNTDAEMQALLSEGTDPVSGNDVPVGAKPEEVRDDIDAKVSENEYVIPAYAVRYFGPRFFDELLASAQQGWERIKEGEEPMPDTQMPEPAEREMEFAEGGAVPKPVGGGYGGYGGTGVGFGGFESKTYINDDTGQEIIIYFYNGKPMSRVPEGFREKAATAVEEQQAQQEEAQDNEDNLPEEQTWINKNVTDWTDEDYKNYTDSLKDRFDKTGDPFALTKTEKIIIGGIGALIGGPLGSKAAIDLAEKANKKKAEAAFDEGKNRINSGSLTEDAAKTLWEDTYYLGSAVNAGGYYANVARPATGDKVDIYGMPTVEALNERAAMQTISPTTVRVVYDSDTGESEERPATPSDIAAGGLRPPPRPAALTTPTAAGVSTTPTPNVTVSSKTTPPPPPPAPRPAPPPPAPLPPATTYPDDDNDYDPFGMTYGTPLSPSDFDESWMPPAADDSNDKEDSKIVCTAMNASYGFGSYRQAIWLSYSQKFLTKEHEVGYHTLFLPLVDLAYNKNNMFVRKILENIARHRTKDLRAEMQNGKRDLIGRAYRSVLEPLCYIVGKIKITMATQ